MEETRYAGIMSAKNTVLFDIIEARLGNKFGRTLVVGCGAGNEAIGLSRRFNTNTIGIDVSDERFVKIENTPVTLRVMSACQMDFPDATFDLLYSFHALEHIHPLDVALAEMRRVIKPGGAFCIGTPNKSRALGAIGSATTLRNKVLWNIADWKMRAMRRWENELGAHAGFTHMELRDICVRTFGQANEITDDYYRGLYGKRWPRLINGLLSSPVKNYAFPAVYMVGRCA